MQLSLLVTYRDRPAQLTSLLHWWQQMAPAAAELWLLEASAVPSPGLPERLRQLPRSHYLHLSCPGVFHKTRALNLGLAAAQGNWVTPFDVDLLPVGATLTRHLAIAQQAPQLLISGYRLLSPLTALDDLACLPAAAATAAI
ncbi:MAG: glycosyltransferase family 2 protein, partial [Spirulinaceae cyanobacterium RM2_2_10]|nr:glycosyltransferase family 2 protein [Spirulinaceae cyanobacterium RM2_2_10]